jgi:cell division cycle protein 37
MDAVSNFVDKVRQRAIVKKKEIDDDHKRERAEAGDVDLDSLPKEERLGPGGLDPVEVFETLPETMQKAFEGRDTEMLKQALMELTEEEATVHMDRCVKSGLWNQG